MQTRKHMQARKQFGLDDRPPCSSCGAPTFLVRREPHPALGAGVELQSFSCTSCEHVQARGADEDGALTPSLCT